MAVPPPIPPHLARRPTKSGLVVPYISLELGGVTYLGQVRGLHVAECLVNGWCQICGGSIDDRPYLFLVTQTMIDDRFSPEPPLHPACAAYSVKACPMVSGRMATYAKHQADLNGAPCPDPGCDCVGAVSGSSRAGDPAEPWYQLWCGSYAVGIRDAAEPVTVGNVTGAVLCGIVKIRPITRKRRP